MSSSDEQQPPGDAPFLPPSRPAAPAPTLPAAAPPSPPVDTPVLPSSSPTISPGPSTVAPAEQKFDAKALVESQRHVNTNPAYGTLPKGTDEGREAARKLREQANRKKRRSKVMGRIVLLLVLAGAAVGGYFVYQAINDEVDDEGVTSGTDAGDDTASGGESGALTPLGEQEQVIDVLDDLNSGARPSAGGLLDAVDEARDVVGQAEPPVAGGDGLLVADVFTPAVLDQTDVLDPADGYERFVVRSSQLAEINPSANEALLRLLSGLPQVPADDATLAAAPVVLPGDVAIAIQRDGDRITRIVAVAVDPPIAAVGP